MNENLDLTKILDGCPEGTKFYSSVYGEVIFERIDTFNTFDEYPIKLKAYNKNSEFSYDFYYTKDGRISHFYNGECTLFPSRDQRDWSKFERFWDKSKVERFDPKTLQPFDKVLVRDSSRGVWGVDIFGYLNDKRSCCFCSVRWNQCIPYNEETKHLLGTAKDCPKYYKWWEEE